jgi:uncharacterized membrane protein
MAMKHQKGLWKVSFVLGAMLLMASAAKAASYSFDVLSSDRVYEAVDNVVSTGAGGSIYVQILAGLGMFVFVARRRMR